MAMKQTVEKLEWRKHILEERTHKDNQAIITKLGRQIKILKNKESN